MTLTPQEVLERLRQAARQPGGFILSIHAVARAGHRSIARRDIVAALVTARRATEQDDGTWRIEGSDDDGSDLTVVVALGVGIEVITVF